MHRIVSGLILFQRKQPSPSFYTSAFAKQWSKKVQRVKIWAKPRRSYPVSISAAIKCRFKAVFLKQWLHSKSLEKDHRTCPIYQILLQQPRSATRPLKWHLPCHKDTTWIQGSPSVSLFKAFHAPHLWTMACKKTNVFFFSLLDFFRLDGESCIRSKPKCFSICLGFWCVAVRSNLPWKPFCLNKGLGACGIKLN